MVTDEVLLAGRAFTADNFSEIRRLLAGFLNASEETFIIENKRKTGTQDSKNAPFFGDIFMSQKSGEKCRSAVSEKRKMAKGKKRKAGCQDPPLHDFGAWADWLRVVAKSASGPGLNGGRLPRREQPKNVFKMTAYRYCRKLQRAKLIDDLKAYVQQQPNGDRWDGHEDTSALWVLRLIALPKETEAVRKGRSRLAAALELAALNKVRPNLLIGFLYEVGPSDVMEEHAAAKQKYPWAKYYRNRYGYGGGTGNQTGAWT